MLLAGRVRGDEEDLRPPDEAPALGHVRPGVDPVKSQLSIQLLQQPITAQYYL